MVIIRTLGTFEIQQDAVIVTCKQIRSSMQIKLFVYLVLYRNKSVTIEDIIAAIWQDEELNNPIGALKNLAYRLRGTLKKELGEQEYILNNSGSYHWNPEIEVSLDIENMEEAFHEAKKQNKNEKAVQYYEQARVLYQGDFMGELTGLHWIANLNTYYHSMYLSAVCFLCEIYRKDEKYEKLQKICNEALKHECANEEIYSYLIQARMKEGQLSLAFETYEKAKQIIEQQMGVKKTIILDEVYEQLLAMSNDKPAADIKEICQDLSESEPEGVFMCGYPVFREICRLEARKSARTKEDVHILLLSLQCRRKEAVTINEFRIHRAMERMEEILKAYLRLGDVAAEYSESQYIILLPNCRQKDVVEVGKRIVDQFQIKSKQADYITAQVEIKDIADAERSEMLR